MMNEIARRRRTHEILELAKPGDVASIVFDVLLVSLITANVLAVIFASVGRIYRGYQLYFYRFELASVAIFTLEYLARVWCSVEDSRFMRTGRAAWSARLRYALSWPALIDLFAILPFYLFQLGLAGTLDLRFLRALRLLRIFKLTRYSQTMTLLTVVLRDNARTLSAVLVVMMIVMTLAASGMYLFEHDAQPIAFAHIPAAMWWAFATLTTVGYGDVTPITVGGKVFGAVITVVGVGMVALPAGILASAFSEQLRQKELLYRDELDKALSDGVIDSREESALEQTRMNLGLSEDSVKRMLSDERRRALAPDELLALIRCPRCGARLAEHELEGDAAFRAALAAYRDSKSS